MHPHPDHVGGLGVLQETFPLVPMYASTTAWIRSDPLGSYGLAHQAAPDFPAQLTYPDRTFDNGVGLDTGGVRFESMVSGAPADRSSGCRGPSRLER